VLFSPVFGPSFENRESTGDVVKTATSETWLKLRDRDFAIKAETETWMFETETSHFSDGNKN